ncbi:Imm53 family immunity protein, partial [Streptomyces vinaceus]|uniref:Imm53 family immunity protein n=1 Tax=Streptomyces vinaceus TaxID=1960 RepID=UPI00381E99F8
DWEHEWGVKIATLDNPGWTVEIDLEETDLEGREYPLQDDAELPTHPSQSPREFPAGEKPYPFFRRRLGVCRV